MELFADIIIDISHSELDKTFQYRIPEALTDVLEPGNVVRVPFGKGNRSTQGYVLRITEHASCPPEKLKTIERLETTMAGSESKLVELALWIRDAYGSTTVQALRTVLPFRQKASEKKKKSIVLKIPVSEARVLLEEYRRKHQTARARLLETLIENPMLPQEIVTASLKVVPAAWRPMAEQGILAQETEQVYRTPAIIQKLKDTSEDDSPHPVTKPIQALTQEQQYIVDTVSEEWEEKPFASYLIHGVTGSGKTAVYMELIAEALKKKKQAILLIPEISLTYQNVIRFYQRFGDRISILHSRLSPAERYDQFERAKSGDIDVMIGPRSALFTPFTNLGMIIIDEEHEPSYKSESVPGYHAREVAIKRAQLEGAKVILGSATPSLEAYFDAQMGKSRLFTMKQRATGGILPKVHVVDMRKELHEGNRSIFSRDLYQKIQERLEKHQQVMLFLNRRGYSGFISCRSCGHVMKCPHCEVSLSLHRNRQLICHYCGYEEPMVTTCPKCGSGFISGFKAGTEQIESLAASAFPDARILRMDADTTRGKDGHAEILRAFGNHEADILVGTQMIVKGHDFPNVTLVGILAADLSLGVSDFRAAERTYQLLTQAAGRAGRGQMEGEVVVQTYDPEHYAIVCSAKQEYEPFYQEEIQYRQLACYPPVGDMMALHCACEDKERLNLAVDYLTRFARQISGRYGAVVLGPVDEVISKINDVYRMVIYIKHRSVTELTRIKNTIEQYVEINSGFQEIKIQIERR